MYERFKHTSVVDITNRVTARWELRILKRIAEAPTDRRGDLLTEEQIRARFAMRIARDIQKILLRYNRGLYAFIEAPKSFLNVEDEGKSMHRYLMHWLISNDETMCLILLSEKTHPYGRRRSVTQADMAEIETKFTRLGYDQTTWLTLSEYRARLDSPEYLQEEN